MKQILLCDWLPERPRWRYLARSGLPVVSRKKTFLKSHKLARSICMAGYWPRSFFACLWTETEHAKKKQFPAILTSRMVNNPHIRTVTVWFLFQDKYKTKAQSFYLPQSITSHHTCLSSICAKHCDFTWIHSPLLTERFCNICDQHGFVRISLAVIFWCTLRTCVLTEINALLNTIRQLIVANLLQNITIGWKLTHCNSTLKKICMYKHKLT